MLNKNIKNTFEHVLFFGAYDNVRQCQRKAKTELKKMGSNYPLEVSWSDYEKN